MTGTALDPKTYYRIFNDAVGANATLSDGYSPDSTNPRTVFVSDTSFSSENWQLLSQNGIWFIRVHMYKRSAANETPCDVRGQCANGSQNFDHGRDYQLGTDGTSVELLESTTKLNQQWTIERGSNSQLFSIQNMAGNNQQFLGLNSNNNPVMTTGTGGVWWRIEVNNAGVVPDDMLEEYTSIEQLPAITASTTRTASSTAITTPANGDSATGVRALETLTSVSNGVTVTIFTADASLQAAATGTGSTSASQESTGAGSSVSPGAIAGGVVGGVVGLAIIAALVFFLCARRKRLSAQSGAARNISAYNDQATVQQEKRIPQTPSSYSSPPAQQWGTSYYQDDARARQSFGASTYTVSPATYAAPPLPTTAHEIHEMDGTKGARESYVELPAGR